MLSACSLKRNNPAPISVADVISQNYNSQRYGGRVRIFKTKLFARFARRERISGRQLCARPSSRDRPWDWWTPILGGGLIKQTHRAGKGRGARAAIGCLLAFRDKDRTVFVYGFAKSDRDNIDDQELAVVREVSDLMVGSPMRK